MLSVIYHLKKQSWFCETLIWFFKHSSYE